MLRHASFGVYYAHQPGRLGVTDCCWTAAVASTEVWSFEAGMFSFELTRCVLLSSLQDELTMDNISRSGLVNMCRYMGLTPFGSDNFLRFQLRNKLRAVTQVRLPVQAA